MENLLATPYIDARAKCLEAAAPALLDALKCLLPVVLESHIKMRRNLLDSKAKDMLILLSQENIDRALAAIAAATPP